MARILPLPPDAVSQIHSSKHIVSLQGVVLSLLENSLDAASSKIEISVDFRRGNCTIEDNGEGIPASEFSEGGGLGKMYHTSKRLASIDYDLHGNTGTYLASLAALSLLKITSRHFGSQGPATLVMHQGRVISRQPTTSSAEENFAMMSPGTSVSVRDLFGNMPVRVKQRALATDVAAEDEKVWQELRRGVVGLLLAWTKPCSVRLRDEAVEGRVLHLVGQHPNVSAALTEKSLNKLAGREIKFELNDVLPMLFQAGLASRESRSNWVPVSASTSKLSVRGVVCLDPVPTKQCQFISIGVHPFSPSSGYGHMYDAVNKVFTNSSFGSMEGDSDVDDIEKDRRKFDRRYKSSGYTQKQLHGRKGVDRWPMFALQAMFKDSYGLRTDAQNMSDNTVKAIEDVLEATVTQWLVSNHFRPRKRRRQRNEDQQSPASASSSPRSLSADRSRITSRASVVTPIGKQIAADISASTSKKRKYVDITGKTTTLQEQQLLSSNQNSIFNNWSRIKSGKETFYQDALGIKKAVSAPAAHNAMECSPTKRANTSVFHLPSVEAGELDHPPQSTRNATTTASPVPKTKTSTSTTRVDHTGSSEDFGSMDESDFLALEDTSVRTASESRVQEMTSTNDAEDVMVGDDDLEDSTLNWTDPVTKKTFKVNSRTGMVLPARTTTAHGTTSESKDVDTPIRQPAAMDTSVTSAGKPFSLARRSKSTPINYEKTWLPGFLRDWNNPVFAQQDEQRIPTASLNDPGADAAQANQERCTHGTMASAFAQSGDAGSSKLSKAGLKAATVIRQVDKKFILCKTPVSARSGSGPEVLVLVDQHAASERIILESLFAELCNPDESSAPDSHAKVRAVALDKPLRFQIPLAEHQLFKDHAQRFREWGISYELSKGEEAITASQVRPPKPEHTIIVRSLPAGIVERCVLVPKLVIGMLRSEVWSFAESAKKPRSKQDVAEEADSKDTEYPWLKRIGSCPKGILEMLNSRSCRSAVMFNDELSIEECEDLLADLSECAFPFMCAHGRVSMVPVVEFGSGMEDTRTGLFSGSDTSNERLSDAFRTWMETENYGTVDSTL